MLKTRQKSNKIHTKTLHLKQRLSRTERFTKQRKKEAKKKNNFSVAKKRKKRETREEETSLRFGVLDRREMELRADGDRDQTKASAAEQRKKGAGQREREQMQGFLSERTADAKTKHQNRENKDTFLFISSVG